jgi:ethanolamine utilization protein EutQ (cupin superfamily)
MACRTANKTECTADNGIRPVEHVLSESLLFSQLDIRGSGQVDIAEGIDHEDDGISAGIVIFNACEFEWQLMGDEYIYVIDGLLEVISSDGRLEAATGDLIRLRQSETVTYRVESHCRVFYVLKSGTDNSEPLIEKFRNV